MERLALRPSFRLHLKARNRAPRTIQFDSEAVTLFARFVEEEDMSADA